LFALKEINSNPEDNTKKEQTPLKSIGNFIKEARLSRNQSVEELASDLKIGSHQLKAIEEGNEEELPEKVFVKAMVRRISQKLKLDTEFIMNEFKTERQEIKVEEIVEEVAKKTNETSQSKDQKLLGYWILILISGFLGLVASSFIFNLFSDSFQNQTPNQELINKTK
jgi:cytoskeletal protein RodZ